VEREIVQGQKIDFPLSRETVLLHPSSVRLSEALQQIDVITNKVQNFCTMTYTSNIEK
jgi:hypothetical protein